MHWLDKYTQVTLTETPHKLITSSVDNQVLTCLSRCLSQDRSQKQRRRRERRKRKKKEKALITFLIRYQHQTQIWSEALYLPDTDFSHFNDQKRCIKCVLPVFWFCSWCGSDRKESSRSYLHKNKKTELLTCSFNKIKKKVSGVDPMLSGQDQPNTDIQTWSVHGSNSHVTW